MKQIYQIFGYETAVGDTIDSYDGTISNIPEKHLTFFNSLDIILLHKRLVFVHAGINKSKPLSQNVLKDFLWIRPPFGLLYETNRFIIHGHTCVNKVTRNNTEMSICVDTRCYSDNGHLSVLEIDEDANILDIHKYK